MAVIRGPSKPGGSREETYRVGSGTTGSSPYDEKTVIARPRAQDPTVAATVAAPREVESEKTRIVGTRSSRTPSETRDFLDDPVVGWLVVVEGPGKGQSLKIGYGQNSIGRAPGQRIRLEFGDDQISREGHAFITYDPKGRKFYVQNGGGSNLIYLGNSPVLVPTEITAEAELVLGKTTIRFVPFCGSQFDWQDAGSGPAP